MNTFIFIYALILTIFFIGYLLYLTKKINNIDNSVQNLNKSIKDNKTPIDYIKDVQELFEKITERHQRTEKNIDNVIREMKNQSLQNKDSLHIQNLLKTSKTSLEFLHTKMDNLSKGSNVQNPHSNSEIIHKLNELFTKTTNKDEDAYNLSQLHHELQVIKKTMNTLLEVEEKQLELESGKNNLQSNVKSKFKSLLDDANLLKKLISNQVTSNKDEIDQLTHDLLSGLSYMEEKIINDLYEQKQSMSSLNQDYAKMEETISDTNQVIKRLESAFTIQSQEISTDLERIIENISPFQSNIISTTQTSMLKLEDSIEDLQRYIIQSKDATHPQISALRESIDALSEYINMLQRQVLEFLKYSQEKPSRSGNTSNNSEMSDFYERLNKSEEKIINFLSFVYKSVNSNQNINNPALLDKLNNITAIIESNSNNSKKYFTTLYVGLKDINNSINNHQEL